MRCPLGRLGAHRAVFRLVTPAVQSLYFVQPFARFFDSGIVGVVHQDFFVEGASLRAVLDLLVIKMRGPKSGIGVSRLVPLERAFEVNGGSWVLRRRAILFIDVA